MRRASLLLALLATVVLAPAAGAEIVTAQDRAGRTMTFDVRAQGADVEWYADLLRDAAHGAEIEKVTVRIVPPADLRRSCGGADAAGCYGGPREAARITVPAGRSPELAHTVLHEYGHHVDAHRGVGAAAQEPNGSASWWAARRLGSLIRQGQVSHSYALGWERAIGELFAEDYVQLHLETPFRIQWLAPPGQAVRAALRRDLENVPAAPAPAAARAPVERFQTGRLRPGAPRSLVFELLGPGRRVTFTAAVARGVAARMEIRCSDGRKAARALAGEARRATIELREAGPARCTATVRATGRAAGGYNVRLRLEVARPPGS